jgi:hypothetical protein
MSAASPDDLATAFRSVPRRLRESQADAPPEVTAAPTSELHGLVEEAARLFGCSADPLAVADAIGALPADQWDDTVLDRLRTIALDLGRLLRHIAALAESE